MGHKIVPFLIVFPMVVAALMYVLKRGKLRRGIAIVSAFGIMGVAVLLLLKWIRQGCGVMKVFNNPKRLDHILLFMAFLLMVWIIWLCIRYKRYWVSALTVIPSAVLAFVRIFPVGKRMTGISVSLPKLVCIDRLSLLLCLITGLMGGLAVIYVTGYLKRYHRTNRDQKDRSGHFMAVYFLFISAMFGVILSENLLWIAVFWELLGVCSFLLIRYSGKEEDIRSAFRALVMNLSGFCAVSAAVLILVMNRERIALHDLVELARLEAVGFFADAPVAGIAVLLVGLAALVLAAQLPFSFWLLGTQNAPMPAKVFLQSVVMTNAGIYMLFRLAPAMRGAVPGYLIAFVGGLTFLLTAWLSFREKDIEKALTLSTVSFMGLMTACAGVGRGETIWIGIFLLIYHGVSKSMLLQNLEVTENTLGTRERETLLGLLYKTPRLGLFMHIGIAGMIFPLIGSLCAKWTKLWEEPDAVLVILMLIILAGAVLTAMCWGRWMIINAAFVSADKRTREEKSFTEVFSVSIHCMMLILLCALLPVLSEVYVDPLIGELYPTYEGMVLANAVGVLVILVAAAVALPLLTLLFTGKKQRQV